MFDQLCQVLYENLTCSVSPLPEEAPSVEGTFRMVLTSVNEGALPIKANFKWADVQMMEEQLCIRL